MKRWKAAAAAVIMGISCSFTAMAEEFGPGVVGKWQQDEGDTRWYYVNNDNTRVVSQWKEIRDQWYYFDDQGYMKTGWIDVDGKRYWADDQGVMAADVTLEISGTSYTFGADGACENPWKAPTVIPSEEEKSELHHTVDSMADRVLAQITNENMTKAEKAQAIYSWVRANMRYVDHSEKGDWVKSAFEGFRRKSGDCYTYYSVSLALLSRAGIPSIEVVRIDGHHWRNQINCGDGWYHFDTTPRSGGGVFFMLTDQQILDYSNSHVSGRHSVGTHNFDRSLYPQTP